MAAQYWRTDNTRIQLLEFIPPNYKVAHMIVSKSGTALARITFAISPSSLSEGRTNNFQLSKTNGGYFAQRMGPSPINLSFDGYMLDIEGYLEKHQFLANWKLFIEDKKTDQMEYQNDYTLSLICQGRQYHGVMQGIQFMTSSSKPFLHQYSCSFLGLSDEYIYRPESDKVTLSKGTYKVAPLTAVLGKTVYSNLTKY